MCDGAGFELLLVHAPSNFKYVTPHSHLVRTPVGAPSSLNSLPVHDAAGPRKFAPDCPPCTPSHRKSAPCPSASGSGHPVSDRQPLRSARGRRRTGSWWASSQTCLRTGDHTSRSTHEGREKRVRRRGRRRPAVMVWTTTSLPRLVCAVNMVLDSIQLAHLVFEVKQLAERTILDS